MDENDSAAAEARAQKHLGARPLRVGHALPVRGATRAFDSWFVPLLAGESLAGFLQLERDLSLRRTSMFPRPVDAGDWLDVERVRERARPLLGRIATEAFLSFDGSPDRLAWRVEAGARVVFVAGTYAYETDDPSDPGREAAPD